MVKNWVVVYQHRILGYDIRMQNCRAARKWNCVAKFPNQRKWRWIERCRWKAHEETNGRVFTLGLVLCFATLVEFVLVQRTGHITGRKIQVLIPCHIISGVTWNWPIHRLCHVHGLCFLIPQGMYSDTLIQIFFK
jgi:hypothetical protein